MKKREIIVGTRGSELALTQTNIVVNKLRSMYPQLNFEIKTIKTTGDKILDKTLDKIGGKGLFVKEIETALLKNEIDIAVHSMKDLPNNFPDGLKIGAVTEREDVRDVLITNNMKKLSEFDTGARVGTSSLRRAAQILALRKDIKIVPIRGNILTRIKKMHEMKLEGIVLAAAGIIRLGLENNVSEFFSEKDIVPAVGQGALGIEIRTNDKFIEKIISKINDEKTEYEIKAERTFMSVLNGGCHVPIGAYAYIYERKIKMTAMVASINGERLIKIERESKVENYMRLGMEVANEILVRGGKDILMEIEGGK